MAFHEPLYGPGAHYFYTPTAGGEVDRSRPTQVGRALERLGVEHIAAYSPQARGRSERVFHTLQDRLVKELHSKRSTRSKRQTCFCAMSISPNITPGSRSRLRRKARRCAILASTLRRFYASRRSVRSATIIACRSTGSSCKYRKGPLRAHFVKTRVKVRQYPDGTHAIFYGPRCLGRYDKKGVLNEERKAA